MSQLMKGCSVLSGSPNLISFNYVGWRKGRGITEFMSYSALPSLARTQQFLLKMQSSSSTCRLVLLWAWAGCCSWSHFVTFHLPFNCFQSTTLYHDCMPLDWPVCSGGRIASQSDMAELHHDQVSGLYFIWGVDGRIRGSLKCVLTGPSPACVNQPVYKWLKWKET